MSDQLMASFDDRKSPGEDEAYDDNGLPSVVGQYKGLNIDQEDQEVAVESLVAEPFSDEERTNTAADGIGKNSCSLYSNGISKGEDAINHQTDKDYEPDGTEISPAEPNSSRAVGESNDKDANNEREIIVKAVPAEEKSNDDVSAVESIEVNYELPKGPDKVVEGHSVTRSQGYKTTAEIFAGGSVSEPGQECKNGITPAEIGVESTFPSSCDDRGAPLSFRVVSECPKTEVDKSSLKDDSTEIISKGNVGLLLKGANTESREEVHCVDGRNIDCNTATLIDRKGRENETGRSYEFGEEFPNDVKSDESMDGGSATDPEPSMNETPSTEQSTSATSGEGLSLSMKLPFITLTLMLFFVGPVQAILTVIPVNTIAKAGTAVRLHCSTSLTEAVYWDRISFGSNENQMISFGSSGMAGFLDKRFKVYNDPNSGKHDLIIEDVQPKDAGIYICIDDSGVGQLVRADLVIAEDFACDMPVPPDGFMGENVFHIPEDIVTPSCSLRFYGNTMPRLHWSWTVSPSLGHLSFESQTSSTVVSTLTLPATKDLNGAVLSCSASLSDEAASPSTGLRWESQPIVVKYAKFESVVVNSCPGVDWCPVCNPKCNYKWERTTDSSSCRCVSIYTDTKGSSYNITLSNLACEPSETPPVILTWQIVIGICVASIASLILIAGAIFFLVRKGVAWSSVKKTSSPARSSLITGLEV